MKTRVKSESESGITLPRPTGEAGVRQSTNPSLNQPSIAQMNYEREVSVGNYFPRPKLNQDLHEFANNTKKRLEQIKMSIANYKAQKTSSESENAAQIRVVDCNEIQSHGTGEAVKAISLPYRDENKQQLDPLDRLAAIKQKLARKIESTSIKKQ